MRGHFVAVAVVIGCSTSAPRGTNPGAPSATTEATLARVRGLSWIGTGERLVGGAVVANRARPALAVTDDAVRLGEGDAWVEVAAERSGPSRDGAGFVTWPSRGGSVTWAWSQGWVEELHVVDGATSLRTNLRVGPAIASVRVEHGRVIVRDRSGRAVLHTMPAWVEDARGIRRDATPIVRGKGPELELELSWNGTDLVGPLVVDPAWTKVAPMKVARRKAAVVTLSDGKVLAIGGELEGTSGTWETYDPVANTWTSGSGALPFDPESRAVRLASGKVLAVSTYGQPAQAQLYDPATNTWSVPLTMKAAHRSAALVALPDGRALVAGGEPDTGTYAASSAVDLFDPSTNTFTAAKAMSTARGGPTAHVIGGKAVVEGGRSSTASNLSTTEIYDAASNSWSSGPSMSTTHYLGTAFSLADGRPVVVGQAPGIVELFSAGAWSAIGTAAPSIAGGAPFGASRALVTADVACIGCTYTGPFIVDGASIVASEPTLVVHREGPVVAPLPGGKVLVAGGGGVDGPLTFAEILAPLANGEACTTGASCASSACVDGVCCASSSCATNQTCAGPATKGTCATKLGAACTTSASCGSGVCVDGVCCDRACTGRCEACDVKGSAGTCTPVAGAPHGTRAPCVATSTTCGLACDGVDATKCNYASKTTPCSSDACSGGIETHARFCDGAGACTDVPKSCGDFACGKVTCNTSCSTKADCAAGFGCKAGLCVAVEGLGKACTDGGECATGFCVDGVCCASAACGTDSTCSLAGKEGTCQKTLGATCGSATECGVGTCVDGVCCDSACTGACEACDVPGKEGTCSAVAGAPHGTRAACDMGAGPCAARTCDGKERATCAGYAHGVESACADAACDGEAFVGASHCDGAGACVAPTKIACAPFVCAKTGCKTTCESNSDCQLAFSCVSGRCIDARARCTADGMSSESSDGRVASCVPYRCGEDGACASTCASSDACAPGFVCDRGTCVFPAAAPQDDGGGGCTYGARRAPSSLLGLSLALLAMVALRRRATLAVAIATTACTSSPKSDAPAKIEAPAPATRDWAKGGSLPTTVDTPVMVAQPDGSALFFGVTDGVGCCKTVYRFDPTTRAFTAAGSQLVSRGLPLVARLSSGKILVAGGLDGAGGVRTTTELYDPASGTSVAGPTMAVGRASETPAAVALAGGDVLLAGAAAFGATTTIAERYVASTGTLVASTTVETDSATLVTLASGKVLLVPTGSASALLSTYDPTAKTWTTGPSLLGHPRQDAHAVRLASGKVLIVGASMAWDYAATAELYDPATNTIALAAGLPARVFAPMVALLPSGRVLVAGGMGYSDYRKDTLVYDPIANAWLQGSPLPSTFLLPGGGSLSDGRVVLVGEDGTGAMQSALFTEGALGATCTKPADCANLQCVDGVCCGTASCPTGSTCAPGGTCKLANGTACTSATACASGQCVDGVCCDSACTGQCAACNVAGKVGKCSPVVGAPRGARPACSGPGLGTVCGASCDGITSTACTFGSAGLACGADACSTGIETRASTCDGAGACKDTSKTCAPYACGATACKTSCASATDCAAGAFCKSGACVPLEELGVACTGAGDCATSSCVDGVCCATSSCAAGEVCNDPASKGRCAKPKGATCAASAECASAHCVDGVCCDTACDGQCEACDVTPGTCAPVDGAPHGARPACGGAGDTCGARACLGSKSTKSCEGFVATAATSCAAARCDGTSYTPASKCDGAGACLAATTGDCTPYACNAEGCLTRCEIDRDCAKGWVCRKNACAREGAVCTADLAGSVDKTGMVTNCAPYLCTTEGTCGTACASSDDCAAGNVCDTTNKTCAAAPSDTSSGCAFGRATTPSWLAIFVLAMLRSLRRRHARR